MKHLLRSWQTPKDVVVKVAMPGGLLGGGSGSPSCPHISLTDTSPVPHHPPGANGGDKASEDPEARPPPLPSPFYGIRLLLGHLLHCFLCFFASSWRHVTALSRNGQIVPPDANLQWAESDSVPWKLECCFPGSFHPEHPGYLLKKRMTASGEAKNAVGELVHP